MANQWYFQAMDREFGPYTNGDFKELIQIGIIAGSSLVKDCANGKWTSAYEMNLTIPDQVRIASPSLSKWTRFKERGILIAEQLEIIDVVKTNTCPNCGKVMPETQKSYSEKEAEVVKLVKLLCWAAAALVSTVIILHSIAWLRDL